MYFTGTPTDRPGRCCLEELQGQSTVFSANPARTGFMWIYSSFSGSNTHRFTTHDILSERFRQTQVRRSTKPLAAAPSRETSCLATQPCKSSASGPRLDASFEHFQLRPRFGPATSEFQQALPELMDSCELIVLGL